MSIIQIERKVDPVALLALLLSLGSLTYSAYSFTKGDELLLIPPEQILIWADRSSSGRELVLFSTRVSCLNRGQPGYPGVIQSAWIWFSLGDLFVEHSWQDFGYSQAKNGKLDIRKAEDAHPVGIEGGGVLSREVFFYPRTNAAGQGANFLGWNIFLENLRKRDYLDFNLTIDVFEEEPIAVTCRIKLTKALVDNLERRKWSAPRCLPIG